MREEIERLLTSPAFRNATSRVVREYDRKRLLHRLDISATELVFRQVVKLAQSLERTGVIPKNFQNESVLSAYLRTSCRNYLASEARKLARRREILFRFARERGPQEPSSIDVHIEARLLQSDPRSDPVDKAIILLLARGLKPYRIADILGINKGNVSRRMAKMKERLGDLDWR